jgi:hypothetical protein
MKWALMAALVAGCSPAPMPISQSPRDPSSPRAPEGAIASNEHQHEGHEHDAAGATYVCPMHPEVTSTSPGVCPKCNMKLVPQR